MTFYCSFYVFRITKAFGLCSACRMAEPVVDMTQFMEFADGEVSSDLLLAQMLQHEFDREHDSLLKIEENHVNKTSRGRCDMEKK